MKVNGIDETKVNGTGKKVNDIPSVEDIVKDLPSIDELAEEITKLEDLDIDFVSIDEEAFTVPVDGIPTVNLEELDTADIPDIEADIPSIDLMADED